MFVGTPTIVVENVDCSEGAPKETLTITEEMLKLTGKEKERY